MHGRLGHVEVVDHQDFLVRYLTYLAATAL
jgi:hypothetical protein